MQDEDGDHGDDDDPCHPVDCGLEGRHDKEEEQADRYREDDACSAAESGDADRLLPPALEAQ